MNYYGPKELAASFRTVRNNTIKIAEEIPEDKYAFRATPESRSVAETLVHMAVATRLPAQIHVTEHLSSLASFDFFAFMGKMHAEEKQARSKTEILDLLRTEGEKYAAILEGASEGFLAETVQYPPGMTPASRSRFEMMMASKEHEMHHRGQLMLIERLIGLTPHLTRQMQEMIAARMAAAGQSSAR